MVLFLLINALLNNSALHSLQNERSAGTFLTSSARSFHKVGATNREYSCILLFSCNSDKMTSKLCKIKGHQYDAWFKSILLRTSDKHSFPADFPHLIFRRKVTILSTWKGQLPSSFGYNQCVGGGVSFLVSHFAHGGGSQNIFATHVTADLLGDSVFAYYQPYWPIRQKHFSM